MSMITWLVASIDKNSHSGFGFVMCLVYSELLRTETRGFCLHFTYWIVVSFTKEFKTIPDKTRNDQVSPCPFVIIETTLAR